MHTFDQLRYLSTYACCTAKNGRIQRLAYLGYHLCRAFIAATQPFFGHKIISIFWVFCAKMTFLGCGQEKSWFIGENIFRIPLISTTAFSIFFFVPQSYKNTKIDVQTRVLDLQLGLFG